MRSYKKSARRASVLRGQRQGMIPCTPFSIFDSYFTSCKNLLFPFVFLLFIVAPSLGAKGQECKNYKDSKGNTIPLQPKSFLDDVISYGTPNNPGQPFDIRKSGKRPKLKNIPQDVLKEPDYRKKRGRGIYSLGCKGWIVGKFIDNWIVDVEGPDIFIFEVGRAKEAVDVEISENGQDWIKIGTVAGSKTGIDAGKVMLPDKKYRYLKLVDKGSSCNNPTAGADIDAIATYGSSWMHRQDDTDFVFFPFGSFTLTPKAEAFLDRLFSEYKSRRNFKLEIEGHTDWVGSESDNKTLSENRASAVANYLISNLYISKDRVRTSGAGEIKPVASNETPEGARKNRRVEFTFIPLSPC